jgi:hypothetical protein
MVDMELVADMELGMSLAVGVQMAVERGSSCIRPIRQLPDSPRSPPANGALQGGCSRLK